MDIKSVDLKAQQIKRDRALNYWQNNVQEYHLPLVNPLKQAEILMRKESSIKPKSMVSPVVDLAMAKKSIALLSMQEK